MKSEAGGREKARKKVQHASDHNHNYQPQLPTTTNHYHYQPLPTTTNHYQPLPTTTNHYHYPLPPHYILLTTTQTFPPAPTFTTSNTVNPCMNEEIQQRTNELLSRQTDRQGILESLARQFDASRESPQIIKEKQDFAAQIRFYHPEKTLSEIQHRLTFFTRLVPIAVQIVETGTDAEIASGRANIYSLSI